MYHYSKDVDSMLLWTMWCKRLHVDVCSLIELSVRVSACHSEMDDSSSIPIGERTEVSPKARKLSIYLTLPDFQDASTGRSQHSRLLLCRCVNTAEMSTGLMRTMFTHSHIGLGEQMFKYWWCDSQPHLAPAGLAQEILTFRKLTSSECLFSLVSLYCFLLGSCAVLKVFDFKLNHFAKFCVQDF